MWDFLLAYYENMSPLSWAIYAFFIAFLGFTHGHIKTQVAVVAVG